jgi:hypothetical protein
MKLGKVCEKHQEFSPDGVCRWCPTPPSEAFLALAEKLEVVDFTMGGPPWSPPPLQQQSPLPVASCKHDGVLYMYGTTTSCAACGKVLSNPTPARTVLSATHYTLCPLRGKPMDADQSRDLANGCTCVPFP